jgi:hypothetical protein
MICHKNKFLFIHIPKTAGTAIESTLVGKITNPNWNAGYKHETLTSMLTKFPESKNYFKFSFVRNPWDLTVSFYHFLWKSDYDWPQEWRRLNPSFSQLSFKEWIKHPFFLSPTLRATHVGVEGGYDGKYADWIDSPLGKLDFIGRFENLQQDFNYVCKSLGIPAQQLPTPLKTARADYKLYYDDECAEIVGAKYSEEIERFGYKF